MPIIAQKTMSQLPLLDPVSSHSGLLLFFRYSYYQRHKTYSRNRDDDDAEVKNVIFSNEISKTAMITRDEKYHVHVQFSFESNCKPFNRMHTGQDFPEVTRYALYSHIPITT